MLKILYEDNHIIVVDKPAGLLSQGDSTGSISILDLARDYIRQKYMKPGNAFLGLVHRLDKSVSGVMVMARTSKAASRLHKAFLEHRVDKYYLALVPRFEASSVPVRLCSWLVREKNITRTVDIPCMSAQKAELEYTEAASNDKYTLIFVKLISGRKHQIRAQLASAGLPVAGDLLYGSSEKVKGSGICLMSYRIAFPHPVKDQYCEFTAGVPECISSRIAFDCDAVSLLKFC